MTSPFNDPHKIATIVTHPIAILPTFDT
jgi:hypothetical protein